MSVDVESLYRQYGPMVLRRCRRMLGDEEQAVDAMQDVFVSVIRHRERLSSDYPSSLLYQIATRTCLNRIRSSKRRPEVPNGELLLGIATRCGSEERVGALGLLTKLRGAQPESTMTIATLHYVDGLTLNEVATEVGMSMSGVRKRLRKLREQLQDLVAADALEDLGGAA